MFDKSENISIKVKFEYFNDENEQKFSKPFDVKISLDEENFPENLVKINKTCKFRTETDRIYYYPYDTQRYIFLTNGSELREFIKRSRIIIMKNCSIYAKQMIELFKEYTKKDTN